MRDQLHVPKSSKRLAIAPSFNGEGVPVWMLGAAVVVDFQTALRD